MTWENLREDIAAEFEPFVYRYHEIDEALEWIRSKRLQAAWETRQFQDGLSEEAERSGATRVALRLAAGLALCATTSARRTAGGSASTTYKGTRSANVRRRLRRSQQVVATRSAGARSASLAMGQPFAAEASPYCASSASRQCGNGCPEEDVTRNLSRRHVRRVAWLRGLALCATTSEHRTAADSASSTSKARRNVKSCADAGKGLEEVAAGRCLYLSCGRPIRKPSNGLWRFATERGPCCASNASAKCRGGCRRDARTKLRRQCAFTRAGARSRRGGSLEGDPQKIGLFVSGVVLACDMSMLKPRNRRSLPLRHHRRGVGHRRRHDPRAALAPEPPRASAPFARDAGCDSVQDADGLRMAVVAP